jgi:hypothetical protein
MKINIFKNLIFLILSINLLIPIQHCDTEVGNPPADDREISGVVHKNLITGASVDIYSLKEDGSLDHKIGTAKTDLKGNFSIGFDEQIKTPVVLISKGGSFEDEATENTIQLDHTKQTEMLRLYISKLNQKNKVSITALTEIASAHIAQYIGQNIDFSEQINTTNNDLAFKFGLSDLKVQPANPKKGNLDPKSEKSKYAVLQAAMSQYALELNNTNTMAIVAAFSEDYLDGVFDSKNNNNSITVEGYGFLPDNAVTNGLKNALKNFLAGNKNRTGLNENDGDTMIVSIPIFQ